MHPEPPPGRPPREGPGARPPGRVGDRPGRWARHGPTPLGTKARPNRSRPRADFGPGRPSLPTARLTAAAARGLPGGMADDAFRAAVLAHPYEHAPRLVWADRMDEFDDPRGPWLRHRCAWEAAALAVPADPAPGLRPGDRPW